MAYSNFLTLYFITCLLFYDVAFQRIIFYGLKFNEVATVITHKIWESSWLQYQQPILVRSLLLTVV